MSTKETRFTELPSTILVICFNRAVSVLSVSISCRGELSGGVHGGCIMQMTEGSTPVQLHTLTCYSAELV